MANGTSLKQQRFIDAYLGEARGNGTEAARIAGYAVPMQEAWRLLRTAEVRARIDERLLVASLSSAEVLAELTDVARADWRDFLQIRTNPVTGEVVDAKIMLGDKVKALELLGKYHKLFTEKVEHSGPGGGPVRMQFEAMSDSELQDRTRLLLLESPTRPVDRESSTS